MKLFGKKAKGTIGLYGLSDWWFSTFTEQERQYLEERYQPMGAAPDSLTHGTLTGSTQPATTFLNGLMTWVRSKEDAPIAKRIHDKIDELGRTQPIEGPGYYQGRHYTTYVWDVEELKRNGRLDEAERLLIELVKATEAEDKAERHGVAPWYYEQLAMIYRSRKEYKKEIAILERFAKKRHAPGVGVQRLTERLSRVQELLNKEEQQQK